MFMSLTLPMFAAKPRGCYLWQTLTISTISTEYPAKHATCLICFGFLTVNLIPSKLKHRDQNINFCVPRWWLTHSSLLPLFFGTFICLIIVSQRRKWPGLGMAGWVEPADQLSDVKTWGLWGSRYRNWGTACVLNSPESWVSTVAITYHISSQTQHTQRITIAFHQILWIQTKSNERVRSMSMSGT